MTDEEVICAWMEPKPATRPDFHDANRTKWWKYSGYPPEAPMEWRPTIGTPFGVQPSLDALWEVEERLTQELQKSYYRALVVWRDEFTDGVRVASLSNWGTVHATAEQKIKALAAVLRPIVGGVAGRRRDGGFPREGNEDEAQSTSPPHAEPGGQT